MIDKAGAQYELAFVVLLEIEAVFGFSRNGNLVIDVRIYTANSFGYPYFLNSIFDTCIQANKKNT